MVSSESSEADKSKVIKTCLSHRGYSIIKVSYALFAVVFIYWFSDSGWFSLNFSYVGLPIIILIMVIAHLFLVFLESKLSARLYKFIFKGRPPTCYLTWVDLHGTSGDGEKAFVAEAFSYGLKRIKFEVIDELELTIWGNLLVKTSKNQGVFDGDVKVRYEPDVLAKLPLGAVSQAEQARFVQIVKAQNPSLILNNRLAKRLESKVVKGEELVKSSGALFLCFVLLDLGYATGYFLEMEKHFYLSQAVLRRKDVLPDIAGQSARRKKALSELSDGDRMMENRSGISLVQRALFDHGSAVGGIYQAKAEALWHLGEHKEAIVALEKAHQLYPKSLKLMVELARWKYLEDDLKGSRKILEKAIEEHSEDLLPCLYTVVADNKEPRSKEEIEAQCKGFLKVLDKNVFGEEPWWPPGGNRFLSERLYREDVIFLARRLMGIDLD